MNARIAWRLVVAFLALAPLGAWSADFHVDADLGSDQYDGASPATAWRSLSRVNAAAFSPGDRIFLKRGSTWREPLLPPSSGTASQPVVFDAYGEGARPLILGSVSFGAPGAWVQEAAGLWFASGVAAEPEMVFHDGRGGAPKPGRTELGSDWDWCHEPASQRVYVRLAENPGSHAVEIVQRDAIGFSNVSGILIANLEIAYARFGIALWGASDWVIDNVHIHDVTRSGVHGNNGSRRIRLQNSLIEDWNWHGYAARLGDGEDFMGYGVQAIGNSGQFSDQWRVTGNTFRILRMQSGEDTTAVNFDQKGHATLIDGNVIIGGNRTGGGIMVWRPKGASPTTISRNWISDSAHIALSLSELNANQFTADVLIERNIIDNACLADQLDQEAMRVWTGNAARIEVRNNLVRGTAAGAHRHDGIRVRQSTGVLLSNNTIYGADIGLLIQDSTDVTIRNTISAGNRGDALRVERTALFSEDHDILSGTVYGVATDPTTTSSDPQFVDSAGGDLRPRAVSPAVDTGAEMAAPQLDLEGRSRPLGEGWDIGAYETAPGGLILPPVNLRILKP